ncbi:MAG: hypothetical protein HYR67_13095 [Bacteroidetes bacterium]|nr:hypothetical protein [Bacteroidota bacterium]
MVLVNQRIVGKVTEVAPDLVTYKMADDDVLHKINKVDLIKICFGNGKVEQSPLLNVPLVAFPEEWANVRIVERPQDIQGVYKIDDIMYIGNTLSETGKNSLKMATAMMGGNIVHINESRQVASTGYVSTPVNYNARNSAYVSHPYTRTYTQTIARIYTSQLPDSVSFREMILQNPVFSLVNHMKLIGNWRYRLAWREVIPKDFRISKYSIEEGNIFVHLKLPDISTTKFHVNFFDKTRLIVSYRTRWLTKYHTLTFLIKPQSFAANKK